MPLQDITRDRLQKVFPAIGVPHDATDWLDALPDEDGSRLYVDQVKPTLAEADEARKIMLSAGIPQVFWRAAEEGLVAYDDVTGDPNPNTTWWLGAGIVG